MVILQVGTKNRGRPANQFVTRYKLSYKQNPGEAENWVIGNDGNQFVFVGNTAQDLLVINNLPTPVAAKYVKLWVVGFHSYPSLRWELFGCSPQL